MLVQWLLVPEDDHTKSKQVVKCYILKIIKYCVHWSFNLWRLVAFNILIVRNKCYLVRILYWIMFFCLRCVYLSVDLSFRICVGRFLRLLMGSWLCTSRWPVHRWLQAKYKFSRWINMLDDRLCLESREVINFVDCLMALCLPKSEGKVRGRKMRPRKERNGDTVIRFSWQTALRMERCDI
jgi:hypothetical protein